MGDAENRVERLIGDSPNSWEWQMRNAIRHPSGLGSHVLSRETSPDTDTAFLPGGLEFLLDHYRMKITPYYASLMKSLTSSDPVFRQSVPCAQELEWAADEQQDPLEDGAPENRPVPTVIHRYCDRALFIPTLSCAVNCRFCFRRERAESESNQVISRTSLLAGLDYIARHEEIREVIVTGGDPLVLSDDRLFDLLERLSRISHLRFLRIHTRMPAVNPFRLTEALCRGLARVGLPVWVVTQLNHPVELTSAALEGVGRLLGAGIPVMNQAVLLRGVNDEAAVLEELMVGLVEARIKPYYLHQLDRARGTGHFRVNLRRGIALANGLRSRISGHAMPLYVLDIPGAPGKVPLESSRVKETEPGLYQVRVPDGAIHVYRDADRTA